MRRGPCLHLPASRPMSPPLQPLPRLRTFIAEDSAIILESLVPMLEEWGDVKVVAVAADESSALAWLAIHAHEVDLLIVDIFLRNGSGLGVLRAVKGLPAHARKLVLTNYATEHMRQKCRSIGADELFDKSTDLDALLAYCVRLHADAGGMAGA
jgi:DNA-binding NarL/FixJ family response regulator